MWVVAVLASCNNFMPSSFVIRRSFRCLCGCCYRFVQWNPESNWQPAACSQKGSRRKGNIGCRHRGGLRRTPSMKINYLLVLSTPQLSGSSRCCRLLSEGPGSGEYMRAKLFSYPQLSQTTLKSWATLDWDAPAALRWNSSLLAHFSRLERWRVSSQMEMSPACFFSTDGGRPCCSFVNITDTQHAHAHRLRKIF